MHRAGTRGRPYVGRRPSVAVVSELWGSTREDERAATPFGAALDRFRAAREEAVPAAVAATAGAPGPGAAAPGREEHDGRDSTSSVTTAGEPETALADDLRARLADRREATAAARYSAATYAALHGHVPGGEQDELNAGHGGRIRWGVRPRTAVVAVGAVLLLGTVVAAVALLPADDVRPLAAIASPEGEVPVGDGQPGIDVGAFTGAAVPSPSASEVRDVVVDVVGQVHTPGLVTLPAGSRVADAVAAAGGATEGAELSAVNLARPLVDGEQLRIPAPGETVAPAPAAAVAPGAGVAGAGATPGGLVNLNLNPPSRFREVT